MQKAIRFSIPDSWRFSDLQLHRNLVTGDVSFSIPALKQAIHPDDVDWLMSRHEDHLSEVLVKLYDYCVQHLGAEDTTVETIIAEIRQESIE